MERFQWIHRTDWSSPGLQADGARSRSRGAGGGAPPHVSRRAKKARLSPAQVARAHGRSHCCHLMRRLRYVIERELPTCVYITPWVALDRKDGDVLCPSAHPIGLPHSRRAPNAFKPALNFHLRPLVGYLDVVTLNVVHVLVIHRPVARWSGRIGSWRTRKYPVRRPLPGTVERTYSTTRLNFKLFYRGFLLCLADQI